MDWLFETPWTLWVVLALAFAVIEMLSLDLFFLMLAISAGITAAISPFVDNMLIRTVIFVVICLILVLGLRPPLLKKLNRSAGNTVTNVEALIGSEVRITQDVTSESGLVVLAIHGRRVPYPERSPREASRRLGPLMVPPQS